MYLHIKEKDNNCNNKKHLVLTTLLKAKLM